MPLLAAQSRTLTPHGLDPPVRGKLRVARVWGGWQVLVVEVNPVTLMARFHGIFQLTKGVIPDHVMHEGRKPVAHQPPRRTSDQISAPWKIEGHVDRKVARIGTARFQFENQHAAAREAILDPVNRQLIFNHVLEREPE